MNNWNVNIINKKTRDKITLNSGLTERQAERFCESWGWMYTDENNKTFWMELECITNFKCKYCGKVFKWDEESIWGHIQMEHEEIFENVQNLDTPYMLEECFDELNEVE